MLIVVVWHFNTSIIKALCLLKNISCCLGLNKTKLYKYLRKTAIRYQNSNYITVIKAGVVSCIHTKKYKILQLVLFNVK